MILLILFFFFTEIRLIPRGETLRDVPALPHALQEFCVLLKDTSAMWNLDEGLFLLFTLPPHYTVK